VYWKDKKYGTVYAYEDFPYWDSEKKQARSKRKYLGKVDPSTGKIQKKEQKPKKSMQKNEKNRLSPVEIEKVIEKTLVFLQLSMNMTLARRLISIFLIVAGLTTERIAKLIGLSDRSVRKLEKQLVNGEFENLFRMGYGGRKRKLADVEEQIIEEINTNNYHTHRQIADMISKTFGIKVSLPTISRLLKKTVSSD